MSTQNSREYAQALVQEISTWEHITLSPHRFGGTEFTLIDRELGHIHHGNAMLDIPYTKPIREQLVLEGKTHVHHLLPDSGWTSYWLRSPADMVQGVWLLRVSYLQKMQRILRQKGESEQVNPQTIAAFRETVPMSEALTKLLGFEN